MSFVHNRCSYCGGTMRITRLECDDCGFSHGGDFYTPRLYRLGSEDTNFVEQFVLSSGSLKHMTELLGVSYPTVRNRLDGLIRRLQDEKRKDDDRKRKVLEDIEAARISAKQGMRIIDAI